VAQVSWPGAQGGTSSVPIKGRSASESSHLEHSEFGKTNIKRSGPGRKTSKETTTLLREWMAAHKAHPYPKNYEKQQLAKQTGLEISKPPYLSCFHD